MSALLEEARALLREIVERLAMRQMAAIDLLGHSLKLVPELEVKRRITGELDLHLRLFGRLRELYTGLGWSDLDAIVRDGAEEQRFPETRLEFGAAYFLTGLAEEASMQSYLECACQPFAAIAESYVEAAPERPVPSRFLAFAAEPTNRPRAQEILDQWYKTALATFALRAGTDQRVRELALRSRTTPELERAFRERLQPILAESGLRLPAPAG